MKRKHLLMSALATAMLFSCGLQPAFTQQQPKTVEATMLLTVTDPATMEHRSFACAPIAPPSQETILEYK